MKCACLWQVLHTASLLPSHTQFPQLSAAVLDGGLFCNTSSIRLCEGDSTLVLPGGRNFDAVRWPHRCWNHNSDSDWSWVALLKYSASSSVTLISLITLSHSAINSASESLEYFELKREDRVAGSWRGILLNETLGASAGWGNVADKMAAEEYNCLRPRRKADCSCNVDSDKS